MKLTEQYIISELERFKKIIFDVNEYKKYDSEKVDVALSSLFLMIVRFQSDSKEKSEKIDRLYNWLSAEWYFRKPYYEVYL